MADVSVRVITWNMGESINKISDWGKELDMWDLLEDDVDILFMTVQEASSGLGCRFAAALKAKMGNNYKLWYDGQGTMIPFQNFHVYGFLFVKNGVSVIKPPHDGATDSVCIYKRKFGIPACTKPSVGFGIVVAKGGKEHRLIFVGSHLPVNVDDVDNNGYGLDERIEAIKTIGKDLIDDIDKEIDGHDVVFWAGDMNFRIQSDGIEQLEQLLKGDELAGFRESSKSFDRTCRLLEYDGVSNFDEFVAKRIVGEGYDGKRTPSYCDRVIFKGSFEPTEYFSWPKPGSRYPMSIAYSDHMVVGLNGIIREPSTMAGGSGYKMKYHKYKSKYLKLKNFIID